MNVEYSMLLLSWEVRLGSVRLKGAFVICSLLFLFNTCNKYVYYSTYVRNSSQHNCLCLHSYRFYVRQISNEMEKWEKSITTKFIRFYSMLFCKRVGFFKNPSTGSTKYKTRTFFLCSLDLRCFKR
jgi:hypothetical protein